MSSTSNQVARHIRCSSFADPFTKVQGSGFDKDAAVKKRLMLSNAIRQLRHGFNRPFMVMFETTLHCNLKIVPCASVFSPAWTKRPRSVFLPGAFPAASR